MSDLFISYVSRDKEFAHHLIEALKSRGIQSVDGRLKLGDSLSTSMRRGLQQAPYAILILSRNFFKKSWPRFEFEELDKLDRAYDKTTKILPIFHKIEQQDISFFSPELAQRMGVSSELDIEEIVDEISDVIQVSEVSSSPVEPVNFSEKSVKHSRPSTKNQTQRPILMALRDNLVTHYNTSELKSLCWDLGIDYEDLAGDSKSVKVIELVGKMQRHGRLEDLIGLVRQQRPNATW